MPSSISSLDYFTFFLHACSEALFKATEAALVSFVLVNNASAVESAVVHMILAHTSAKKSLEEKVSQLEPIGKAKFSRLALHPSQL